ncbi:MAG: DNA alkylation repair protein [Pararhodobacter sp.]
MEPFKNFLSPAVVRRIADHLVRVQPGLDHAAFMAPVLERLESLEMKARAGLIAEALHRALPADPGARAATLEAMLHPACNGGGDGSDDSGLRGWAVWPLSMVIERHGLADFDGSLALLRHMTMRFTAEFAVRPFLIADQPRALAVMAGWLDDPNEHVRRLVSEGTRPRLPWGMRLPALIADPAPALPLLEALRDDPAGYVRRSVANHLNDIAKDHPALVCDLAGRWIVDAPPERRVLLRHACRGLIKAGDPAALAVFGQHAPQIAPAVPVLARDRLAMGEVLEFSVRLRSTAARDQTVSVDYLLYFRKADGSLRPKVFKGVTRSLAPGETWDFTRRHALRPVTTRRHYPGEHALALRINGQDTEAVAFDLRLEPSGSMP